MKRVVVRVNDRYSLDSASAAILKLYGYLTYVESYRSFQIITFDCPQRYQDNLLNQLRALNVVKRASWDEEKYSCDPIVEGNSLEISTSGSKTLHTVGEGAASEYIWRN